MPPIRLEDLDSTLLPKHTPVWPDDAKEVLCQLHALCDSCKKTFACFRAIRSYKTQIFPGNETHCLHSSLADLENAAQRSCHFCTLVLEQFQRYSDISNDQDRHSRLQVWLRVKSPLRHSGVLLVEFNRISDRRPQQVITDFRHKFDLKVNSSFVQLVASDLLVQQQPLSHNELMLVAKVYQSKISFRNSSSYSQEVAQQALRKKEIRLQAHRARRSLTTSSIAHQQLAKSWLQECLGRHVACQRKDDSFTPTRLIYVGGLSNQHISLSLQGDHYPRNQYCALSHCWGGRDDILTLTTKNIELLRREIPMSSLPKTFQDAIVITRFLGQKFLWLDSLCILQDSQDDWTVEAATMGGVYENSVCTIVALGAANAHEGCFAERNPLSHTWCKVAESPEDGLFVRPESLSEDSGDLGSIESLTMRSVWAKRAWVFQERLLSPRLLYFGDREMLWSCKRSEASEWNCDAQVRVTESGQLSLLQEAHMNFSDSLTTWMAHKAWWRLVSSYSAGRLTQIEDRLVAISGVARRVREYTGMEYLGGFWRETLIYDLLWIVSGDRRQRDSTYLAPTWSWASVSGKVSRRSSFALDSKEMITVSSEASKPLIQVVSATVKSHVLDDYSTGQVFDGSLTVVGMLATAGYSFTDITPGETETWNTSVELPVPKAIWRNGKVVGALHHDVEPFPNEGTILLFPIFIIQVKTQTKQTKGSECVGLALRKKDEFYERVGLFALHSDKTRLLTSQWFEDAECTMQTITVR